MNFTDERINLMADNSNRGFASMDDDQQREIASKGGHAAHESGNAHEFDSEEAREAGRKGGETRGNNQQNQGTERGQGARQQNDSDDQQNSGNTRGGSSEQHAEAGRQSHKNQ
jgi:general stress protein YciG